MPRSYPASKISVIERIKTITSIRLLSDLRAAVSALRESTIDDAVAVRAAFSRVGREAEHDPTDRAKEHAPQETGESIGREKERGSPTAGTGGQFPVGVRGRVTHPLAELAHSRGIGSVEIVSHNPCCNECGGKNQNE